ncbi:acylphosphatase [Kiloniella laminariae]|uniref:acylphosphatase n=1 Tax=Kiloniella laminariae TaxID=454162 RepID=UPI000376C49C|nr:acylphosphatase [Kiloniella laminariae]
MADKQIRVVVTGRVQGVWFRRWTVDKARELGLSGWVRNLASGQVEAIFKGPEKKVVQMLEACQEGPDLAEVTLLEQFSDSSSLSPEGIFVQLADK